MNHPRTPTPPSKPRTQAPTTATAPAPVPRLVDPAQLVLVAATVLVGLSAGFFFTYEASVTLAVGELDDPSYVRAFQAINETVRNPAFGVVFFGSIPAMGAAIAANWSRSGMLRRAVLAGALALYLCGLVVTGTGNVPLNEELAQVDSTDELRAATARTDFETDWNRLNLIRALAIGGSFTAMAFTLALPAQPR